MTFATSFKGETVGLEDNNETDNTGGIHIYLLLNAGVHNSQRPHPTRPYVHS